MSHNSDKDHSDKDHSGMAASTVNAFASVSSLRIIARHKDRGIEVMGQAGNIHNPAASLKLVPVWKKMLADYKKEEPDTNFVLQTRGTVADWHELSC